MQHVARYDFQKFHRAQLESYERALREIRSGRKTTHWIWYIFPQLRALGHSENAKYYGISGLEEARAYLRDDILRDRLVEISSALLDLPNKNAAMIFGWPDDMKLRSSMTLFALASDDPHSVFRQVLDAYFDGEMDMETIRLLKSE